VLVIANVMSHLKSRGKLIALWAVAHAFVSAILWIWALGVAMGLGFKDRAVWTMLDHLQAAVVPAVAFTLTAPGRFYFAESGGWTGLVIVWTINSLLWAALVVSLWSVLRRWSRAT
jgi:hypothetical protein